MKASPIICASPDLLIDKIVLKQHKQTLHTYVYHCHHPYQRLPILCSMDFMNHFAWLCLVVDHTPIIQSDNINTNMLIGKNGKGNTDSLNTG